MADRYVYPAIFEPDEGKYSVSFPDLPGCVTCGATIEEALARARSGLAGWMYGMERDGDPIPARSDPSTLEAPPGGFVSVVDVWMPPVRNEIANKAVNKMVTLPRWLNDLGEQRGVNFSQLLQAALKNYLGVAEPGR